MLLNVLKLSKSSDFQILNLAINQTFNNKFYLNYGCYSNQPSSVKFEANFKPLINIKIREKVNFIKKFEQKP